MQCLAFFLSFLLRMSLTQHVAYYHVVASFVYSASRLTLLLILRYIIEPNTPQVKAGKWDISGDDNSDRICTPSQVKRLFSGPSLKAADF
jgi:hypothetical protein